MYPPLARTGAPRTVKYSRFRVARRTIGVQLPPIEANPHRDANPHLKAKALHEAKARPEAKAFPEAKARPGYP